MNDHDKYTFVLSDRDCVWVKKTKMVDLTRPAPIPNDGLDRDRLENAIEICEQGLDEAGKYLSADKRARLILVIYSMIGKTDDE